MPCCLVSALCGRTDRIDRSTDLTESVSLKKLVAPVSVLSEILSRWPRKRNQGPPLKCGQWYTLPLAFNQQLKTGPVLCRPREQRGVRVRRRFDLGSIFTTTCCHLARSEVAGIFTSKFLGGIQTPLGSSSFTALAVSLVRVSFRD